MVRQAQDLSLWWKSAQLFLLESAALYQLLAAVMKALVPEAYYSCGLEHSYTCIAQDNAAIKMSVAHIGAGTAPIIQPWPWLYLRRASALVLR